MLRLLQRESPTDAASGAYGTSRFAAYLIQMLGILAVFALGEVAAYAAILRIPEDYPTIQAGLTAARKGDTVLVSPGIYVESVVMQPGVHLQGEPGAILDGAQTAAAIVSAFSGIDQTAVLSGFIIRRSRRTGIFLNQATPLLRNNIIIDNAGPGIECAQASPQVLNNIIMHNAGGGIVCNYPNTAPIIAYNAFWHNQPEHNVGCTFGVGNIEQAPGFVDAQQNNYRLQPDSPLIDAGDPMAAFNDPDGSRNDIGVYGGPRPARVITRPAAAGGIVTTQGLRNSLSAQGLPGIIDIPTATMVPSGSVDLSFNTKRDDNVFGERGADEQQNFNFALGLLPRVTIGGRGTIATDTTTDRDVARDISANVQFLLVQEGLWWPSVAIGLQDIAGGATNFRSRYVVLSKTFFGRVRGTAGFGVGPDVLDGPFAGVEFALNRYITLLGEYDSDDINVGVRLFPLPEQLEAYGIPRPTVDLIWHDGDDFAWGVTLRSPLGEPKFRAQRAARIHKRYHRYHANGGVPASFQEISEQLQAALITEGLENVRVTVLSVTHGHAVVVEYENRRYNRDELHGLGLVLGLTALYTPPTITYMSIVVKEVNLPVLKVSTSIEAFLAFVNGEMSLATFGQAIEITQNVKPLPPTVIPVATTALDNRSWLKVDTIFRPGLETLLFTDISAGELRFRLLPDTFMQLFPGAVFNVRANIPVTQTTGFPGPLGDPEIDRILGHYALPLPLGSWSSFATGLMQFSVGRFSADEVGVAHEIAFTALNGQLFFKNMVARVGSAYDDLDRWVALANGRVRYPPWDVTLSITAGLFLDQDAGIDVDLSRFFGNTEVGVFLRHSTHGSLGGVRLALPLTPARELPPRRFRPRLPEVFSYEQRTTVFTDRNTIRNDIGRSLDTGHAIEWVYWNRDRLYPVYIRQHLDTLRQAVRRWIDDEAIVAGKGVPHGQ